MYNPDSLFFIVFVEFFEVMQPIKNIIEIDVLINYVIELVNSYLYDFAQLTIRDDNRGDPRSLWATNYVKFISMVYSISGLATFVKYCGILLDFVFIKWWFIGWPVAVVLGYYLLPRVIEWLLRPRE